MPLLRGFAAGPGSLSTKDIIDVQKAVCTGTPAADFANSMFFGHTLNFWATAINYFKVRRDAARSLGNAAEAARFEAFYQSMAQYTDLLAQNKAACDDILTATVWFLNTVKGDTADPTRTAMIAEIRDYYFKIGGQVDPDPGPELPLPTDPLPTSRKTPAWMVVGGIVTGVVVAGGIAWALAKRKKRRR